MNLTAAAGIHFSHFKPIPLSHNFLCCLIIYTNVEKTVPTNKTSSPSASSYPRKYYVFKNWNKSSTMIKYPKIKMGVKWAITPH